MSSIRKSLVSLAAAALMLLAVGAQADTLNVGPGGYATIQAAIDAAHAG